MTSPIPRGRLLVAVSAGALSGAGYLGLGYGLGVLRLGRAFDAGTSHWPAQLVWVTWFTMSAALLGAAVAHRAAPAAAATAGSAAGQTRIGVRVASAIAAALGALVVAPLSMVPAHRARVPSVEDPVLVVGLCAGLGAAVGLAVALAVPGPRPARWNLAAITGAVWLLAVVSLLPSMGPTDPMPAVRLGVFDPAWLSAGTGQRLAMVTMPALALVAGAVAGGVARWRAYPPAVVATCGVTGPATLSLAYLIGGLGADADRYQAVPYWAALAATAAGLLGSALAATVPWPVPATPTPQDEQGDTDATPTPPGNPPQDKQSDPEAAPAPEDNPGSPDAVPEPSAPAGGDATDAATPDGLAGSEEGNIDTPTDRPDQERPTARVPRPRGWRARVSQIRAERARAKQTAEPPASTERNQSEPDLPAADAEYVDWVSGLRGRDPQRDATRAGRPSAPRRPSPRSQPDDR